MNENEVLERQIEDDRYCKDMFGGPNGTDPNNYEEKPQ